MLVAYDERGKVIDFGMVEVQGVYISGNIRRPFAAYMEDQEQGDSFDWSLARNYPRPDYLSSSRKRLVPQLMYKGGIIKSWGKRQSVVLHRSFFDTLPELPEVDPQDADVVWLVYDLEYEAPQNQYILTLKDRIYTMFKGALDRIAVPEPGPVDRFVEVLQDKLDAQLEDEENPPDAPTLTDLLG